MGRFPYIDAQRQLWSEFDIEALIDHYSSQGWSGVKTLINEHIHPEGYAKLAMTYSHEYKKKHALDPYGYPVDHLVRTLLLNAFAGSPTPVGPKTKAHAKRLAALNTEAAN